MTMDGRPVTMEANTGAAKIIMPEKSFCKLWPGRSLDKIDVRLQSYLGEPIHTCQLSLISDRSVVLDRLMALRAN